MNQRDLNDDHVVSAGNALKQLKYGGDPYDAQVVMAIIGMYLCHQYEWNPDEFTLHMSQNMKAVAKNTDLFMKTLEGVHNQMKGQKIIIPLNGAKKN